MTTTLVTGGAGFVGRYIVNALVARGDRVVTFNRDYTDSSDDVVAVQGELFETLRLIEVLREHRVDRIIHTAAQSHPEVSVTLPLTTFASNVDGTLKLFEAARSAGVRRIVNFSSECAYGHQEGPVFEDALLRPTTPYGVSKAATEMLASVYTDLYGMDIVSLRVTEVFGPGNRMPEVLKEMICSGLGGPAVEMPHGADHPFQFVHVEDVAAAALLAADLAPETPYRVFNVTGGRHLVLAEAAAVVRELVPGAQVSLGPGPIPQWDQQGEYDLSRSRDHLGYRPRYTLDEGIRTYSAWLGQHPH